MYKNLVVVGGGFSGTKVAQELEHTLRELDFEQSINREPAHRITLVEE